MCLITFGHMQMHATYYGYCRGVMLVEENDQGIDM